MNAANVPPTANAGANQTITLPTSTVSLSGSRSSTSGTISSYAWTKTSGPTSGFITNSNSASTTVSGLVQGIYQFQLTVTDNNGLTGISTVQVTVNSAKVPPTANAGINQVITLPVNIATLSGSGSDVDGTISVYKWAMISGPSGYNIVNPLSPVTDVSGLTQGVYQFQLTVTDNNGLIGTSMVQITVDAASITVDAASTPPIANAGNDTTVLAPVDFVTLNGSGTDQDGTILAYSWIQVSGPSTSTIQSNNTATTNVSNLVEGTYEFEFTVTDNNGLTGTDTVAVNVAEARLAARTTTTNSIKAFPNPVQNIANLQINTAQANTDIMIVITDMWGKSVYSEESVSSTNNTTIQINMSNLIKGTYIITVLFDGIDRQSIKVLRM